MDPAKILIVDDEPSVRTIIERTLEGNSYVIDSAANGLDAILKLKQSLYDLILLDLNMEPVSGLEVLQTLRDSEPDTVVIILTAHGSMESAVEALRLGAFDYIFKPASPNTIRKRVQEGLQFRAQILQQKQLLEQIDKLRGLFQEIGEGQVVQSANKNEQRFLKSGELIIDRHHRTATLGDQLLDLTTTEYNFLLCLAEVAPHAVPHSQLVNCALNYECDEIEAREIAKWHIHNLRKKIEKDPAHPIYIKTVRYKGYLWCNE